MGKVENKAERVAKRLARIDARIAKALSNDRPKMVSRLQQRKANLQAK